jgi:hypothetical protein
MAALTFDDVPMQQPQSAAPSRAITLSERKAG